MKLKELETHLQKVEGFERPKILLEQYPTRPHIASRVLHTIQSSFEDLEGKYVADLGVGCGMLSVGAILLGAECVVGFDIDSDALDIARTNFEYFDIEDKAELVLADVVSHAIPGEKRIFDTVVMNPPFGTKRNWGVDMNFVKAGLGMAETAVYSLHKTSTRDHILKKGREWGINCQVVAELRYDLPQTYKHHKRTSVDIEVDFIRFSYSDRQ